VTGALGTPRLHLRATGSTNERARELAWAGAPHGTLVTASEQTAGRGRQGRTWAAPPGRALLMSLVLREHGPLLSLAAAVAVCDVAGPQARIKWPNDVLLGDRKVAGILAEGRPQEGWLVLGIGVNVAVREADLPPEVRPIAASLGLEPAAVEGVLERLLAALQDRCAQGPADLLADYAALDALRGREISWRAGHGVAAGIDAEGRLLVDPPDGARVALSAGEVHLGTGPPPAT
jgi:BirA family biotin operon repressor/biotin-[acetyl-CoA-carboxylase] ligase